MDFPLIPADKDQLTMIRSCLLIDDDRHTRNLELFKDWIKSEPHLPDNIDDSYLSNFLALCKDDLGKAKSKFETNIVMRKSQYYLSRDDILTMEELNLHDIARQSVPVPQLTQDGYRIIYLAFPKPGKVLDLAKNFKYGTALLDIMLWEDKFAGMIGIADYTYCTVESATKVDISILTGFLKFLINAWPSRLKNYHIINIPSAGKPFIAVLRALLPEKLKNRMIVHDHIDDLKKYLPEDLIPIEYGGKMQSLDELCKIWERYYLENDQWVPKLKKLVVRGDIPQEKLHLDQSCGFGVDGTFRNLKID